MAGAYVALPPVATEPDVPPGWGGWPFPGPLPPGYEMDLSLAMTTPAVMSPGFSVADIQVTLYDHATYQTPEPSDSTIIVYTATLKSDGSEMQLKVSGDSEYSSSIERLYTSLDDDYWGDEPEFMFDVSVSDIGDYVVLQAASTPLNLTEEEITTSEIAIAAATISITIEAEIVAPDAGFPDPGDHFHTIGKLFLMRKIGYFETEFEAYAIGEYTLDYLGEVSWANYADVDANVDEITPTAEDELLSMEVAEAEEETYYVSVAQQNVVPSIDYAVDMDVTIKTYANGVLHAEETFSRTQEIRLFTTTSDFATIDGGTGDITLIEPPVEVTV